MTEVAHPKAIAAQERAAKRREHIDRCKRVVKHYRAQRVQFLTISDHTFAYLVTRKNVIAVSSTIRNPIDRPNKWEGMAYAAHRLGSGAAIILKVPTGQHPKEFLYDTFYNLQE